MPAIVVFQIPAIVVFQIPAQFAERLAQDCARVAARNPAKVRFQFIVAGTREAGVVYASRKMDGRTLEELAREVGAKVAKRAESNTVQWCGVE